MMELLIIGSVSALIGLTLATVQNNRKLKEELNHRDELLEHYGYLNNVEKERLI